VARINRRAGSIDLPGTIEFRQEALMQANPNPGPLALGSLRQQVTPDP
jgi:hypothetical protein